MSVVSGCRLLDGAVLLADSRSTVKIGNKTYLIDNLLKLIPLTEYTIIGFVGNVQVVARIFRDLFDLINTKKRNFRLDPVSLLNFFPRFLRYKFTKIKNGYKDPDVHFIVASLLPDHCNKVERSQVTKLMDKFRTDNLSMQRNWIPAWLVNLLEIPQTIEIINILDQPLAIVQVLKSPRFISKNLKAFEFATIGSGEGSYENIEYYSDWIFANDIGNAFTDSIRLRNAVDDYIIKNNIDTVGGLYPSYKISKMGVEPIGYKFQSPSDNFTIELCINKNNRWVQKNLHTGKEIELLYPWEIDFLKFQEDNKFDDYRDFMKERLK